MPTGTTFDPINTNFFEKTKLNKAARGVIATITAGATQSLDLTLTDDVIMAGGTVFLAKDASWGDKVAFQVVHPALGVVNEFIESWYVDPSVIKQEVPPSNYPAKLVAGLILRIVYQSTGTTDVKIAVNYNLEKVLV